MRVDMVSYFLIEVHHKIFSSNEEKVEEVRHIRKIIQQRRH